MDKFDFSCCNTFNSLKKAFISTSILIHWIPNVQLIMKTNISNYALTAILSIVNKEDEVYLVAFYFHTFTVAELCHMPSLSIWKIHLCSDTVSSTSIIQVHLLQQQFFLQHVFTAAMQQSGYPINHDRDTSIQLSLLWQSSPYSYQCLTTETSTQSNKGYTTETLSISYIIYLYIRLVVIL